MLQRMNPISRDNGVNVFECVLGDRRVRMIVINTPGLRVLGNHYHPDRDETVLVAGGLGQVFLLPDPDGQPERFDLSSGTAVHIPAGTPHAFAVGELSQLFVEHSGTGDVDALERVVITREQLYEEWRERLSPSMLGQEPKPEAA